MTQRCHAIRLTDSFKHSHERLIWPKQVLRHCLGPMNEKSTRLQLRSVLRREATKMILSPIPVSGPIKVYGIMGFTAQSSPATHQ